MLLRLIRQLIAPGGAPARVAADEDYRRSPREWLRHGEALERAGDLEGALRCYRACAAAHPADLHARLAIVNALTAAWRMDECIEACAQALALAPSNTEVFSGLLLYSHYASRPDARALFDLHRRYGELASRAFPARHDGAFASAEPERRLRVGYVSRNFSLHSVGYFIEPVVKHHDRSRYEVYCYYTHPDADATSARIAARADAWRQVHEDDADALAERIRGDSIDVLVDLGGHTKLNRLGAFAQRPAPVQATWLGYPDTTGVGAIDYRITDGIADPAQSDLLHTERLMRLEPPFLCYRPADDAPPVASRPRAREVVFGSFNILVKVNEPLIGWWARILAAVPGSRLVLKSRILDHEDAASRLLACFAAAGIAADRLELRGWAAERAGHLGAYGDIDIALDTYPYNGTTTTCEALWMGVPVITLAGDLHMSRVGASLLTAAGLGELVAGTPEEYVDAAVALANDPARRHAYRSGMRQRLAAGPLLDHAGFTAKLERALREAWRAWCATVAPAAGLPSQSQSPWR